MKELMDSLKIGLNADSVSKDNIDITNCKLLKILNKKGLPVIPCEE
jgi:NADPH-dependent 7-cyano-7-deazaguanine reductase QueF-like protein